jgi:hypothetical protein
MVIAASLCAQNAVAQSNFTPPAGVAVSRSTDAPDCPDAATLAVSVADIRGVPSLVTTRGADTRLQFEVEVTRNRSGYAAVIRASGSRSGERRIADIGEDCSGLAQALAVTIAIILDDERDAPADPVPTTAEWAPRKTSTAQPPVAPPRKSIWRPYALGVGTVGVLESVAFGPSVGLSLDLGQALIGADALWLLPRTFDLPPGRVDVSLVAASVYGCWRAGAIESEPWVGVCAHVSAGSLGGSADGFTTNKSARRPWIAPGIGTIAGGPLVGSIEWFAQGKLYVPVHEERFVIDNVGTAHTTPPLGALAGLGLAVSIQ